MIDQLISEMRMMVDFMKPSQRSDQMWSCTDEIILRFGKAYEYEPLPNGMESGEPQLCYWNSAKKAMAENRYVYVEGYGQIAGHPFLTEHAWLVERGSSKVIDLTIRFDAYFGIPFRTSYLVERWKAFPKGVALIKDFWKAQVSLLNMDETELLNTVVEDESRPD